MASRGSFPFGVVSEASRTNRTSAQPRQNLAAIASILSFLILFLPARRSIFQYCRRQNLRRCLAHSFETASCPFCLCPIMSKCFSVGIELDYVKECHCIVSWYD